MGVRNKWVDRLVNLDVALGSITLALLLVTLFIQIVLRFLFSIPFMGAEELTRYFVICVVMLPLAFVERTNSHVIMEELQAMLPKPVRTAIRVVINITTTVVYIILAASSISVLVNNAANMTATLEIPFWLFFAPTVIGVVGIVLVRLTSTFCLIVKKEVPWDSQ